MSDVYLPFPAINLNGATLEEVHNVVDETLTNINAMAVSDDHKIGLRGAVQGFWNYVFSLVHASGQLPDNIKVSASVNSYTNGKGTITPNITAFSVMPIVAEFVDDSTKGDETPE